jgi:CRP/FNR family transcriptional regulator, cyclic AMP receptor protein
MTLPERFRMIDVDGQNATITKTKSKERVMAHPPFSDDLPAVTHPIAKELSGHRRVVYEAGEPAFDSDDTLHSFYFVLRGKIKISQVNPESSKEQTISLLERGDMYDVVTLLDGGEHDFIAMALEESEVLEVPIENVRELIESNPAFNRYFFPYLGRQMRQMEELAVDLSLYDVYNRLIRLFARNVERSEPRPALKLVNNLSHEELAAMVGSVRKVVNRNLQKLKKEGIIELSRKQIRLKSLKELLDKLKY